MSNVPTRNKQRNFQSTQDIADTHQHIDGTLKHDDCFSYLPVPSGIFTPISAVGRTSTSVTTSSTTTISSSASARRETTRSPPAFSRSPPLKQRSAHTRNDVAIQSPITLQIDIQPFLNENAFLNERQSPGDNVTEIVDAAARNLRRTPP